MTVAPESAVHVRNLLQLGLTKAKLRTSQWQRRSRGLYLPSDEPIGSTTDLLAMATVLPAGSGFGHLTSASIRGWWLPNRLGRHVVLASTVSDVHIQRCGMYVRRCHRLRLEEVNGIPVVCAEQTLVELARDLSLVDLVPMVDVALAMGADPGLIRALARRQRGAVNLRAAIELSDPRSESWWESMLRLVHVVAGVGPVDSQVELWDGEVLSARADLHLVGTSRYPECDGGEHRTAARHAQDLRREKELRRLGCDRYGYTTQEIERQPHMIIRDAEVARGWAADPARVSQWWALAQASTLTSHGRTRLAARLLRYRLAARRVAR